MKKIILTPLIFILWIWIVFAANNYFKFWYNWDANVIPNWTLDNPNDTFSLTWRLDLEDSRTSRYINDNYRWKITWNIVSKLFWEFELWLSWSTNQKIELYLSWAYWNYNSLCNATNNVEIYSLSWAISSTHWWEMLIGTWSYFCSNQYTHIVFNSDRLWNKDIWINDPNDLVDDFWKQEIAISGIANLKWNVDILARWDDKINQLWVSVSSKALVKQNVNKRVFELFKTYVKKGKTSTESNEDKLDVFSKTKSENYYLYDYSWDSLWTNIKLNWSDYINEWKYLTIWTDWENKIPINWKHTVIVNWWNIYINSNLYNTNDTNSLLVLVAKRWDNKNWWNIYIDPDVTNIDAILIADWSLISMESNTIQTVDESGNIDNLRKQLYIYGSVLSSNTVWSSTIPYGADYYDEWTYYNNKMEDWWINTNIYDLWNLRTFNLNYWDVWTNCTDSWSLAPIDWNWDYILNAWAWRKQCYNSDPKDSDLRWSTKLNPLIIEYNKRIPLINPYILQK